jgi:hypothetical protein
MENNIESSGKINPETLKEKIELSGKVLRQLALWGIMTLGPLQGLEAKTIADDTNDGVKIEKNISIEPVVAVVEDKDSDGSEIQKQVNATLKGSIETSIVNMDNVKVVSRPDINSAVLPENIEKLYKNESNSSSEPGDISLDYYIVVDSSVHDLESKIIGFFSVSVIDLKNGKNYSFISDSKNVNIDDIESQAKNFSETIVDKIKNNKLSEMEPLIANPINK